jgi:protein ImuB
MFACIYVSDFPVEAIVRSEPLLREQAVAVLEGKPPLTRVISVNERARSIGMEIGMTKLQAEALLQ